MKLLKRKQLLQQAITYATNLQTGSCNKAVDELENLLFVLRSLLRAAQEVAPKEYAKALRKGGKEN